MNENVINSLFGCFDRLRNNNSLVFKDLLVKENSFASPTRYFFFFFFFFFCFFLFFLRASLRKLVNYFSVIDQNNQINSILPAFDIRICFKT